MPTFEGNMKRVQEAREYNNKIVAEIKELETRAKQLELQKRAMNATDAGLIATAGNKLPIEPLKMPKLVSGFHPLMTLLDPLKSLQANAVYTTGTPSLSLFNSPYDGANAIQESDMTVANMTLASKTYANFMSFSDEVLWDSGIDLEAFVKSLHSILVTQKHEDVALANIVASTLTQSVTCATPSTIALTDLQATYNKLSSPVRKDAVWIVQDDSETALQTITCGGLPILRYSDELGMPTMMGKPVFFSPSLASTNNAVILADLSAVTVQPFDNGDSVFKVTKESSAFANDQTVFRLLARFDVNTDREGSTALLKLS